MGGPKTALDLERLMHDAAISRNRATNTPEETEDFETIRSGMASRLDAIPADALSQIAKLKAERAAIQDVCDTKDDRPPDEQLEDLLGYMDVLTDAIDAAGVGDEARALDEPRAVAEAIDILAERGRDSMEQIAALTAELAKVTEERNTAEVRAGDLNADLAVAKAENQVLDRNLVATRADAEVLVALAIDAIECAETRCTSCSENFCKRDEEATESILAAYRKSKGD